MNPSALLGHRRDTRRSPDTRTDAPPQPVTTRPVREVDPPRRGPASLPASGWLAVAKRTKSQPGLLSIPLLASGVAFWAILSIFPAAIAAITVYGLIASPQTVSDEIADLSGSLSPATSTVLRGLADRHHHDQPLRARARAGAEPGRAPVGGLVRNPEPDPGGDGRLRAGGDAGTRATAGSGDGDERRRPWSSRR